MYHNNGNSCFIGNYHGGAKNPRATYIHASRDGTWDLDFAPYDDCNYESKIKKKSKQDAQRTCRNAKATRKFRIVRLTVCINIEKIHEN